MTPLYEVISNMNLDGIVILKINGTEYTLRKPEEVATKEELLEYLKEYAINVYSELATSSTIDETFIINPKDIPPLEEAEDIVIKEIKGK